MAPRPYHHGDLRQALVSAGLEILNTEGLAALTLRGVARRAGVSHTAPYRHFADRRMLVAAIAQDGFRQLGDAMEHASSAARGRQSLKNVAFAYVRFAHENPAVYRVMFGPELAHADGLDEFRAVSRAVLASVGAALSGLQQARLVGEGDPRLMSVAIWSMVHGLVMLSLDGQTESVGASLDALTEEATRVMMFGMAPR